MRRLWAKIHDEYDDEERTYAVLNDHTWVFEAKTQLTDFYKITKIDEETSMRWQGMPIRLPDFCWS